MAKRHRYREPTIEEQARADLHAQIKSYSRALAVARLQLAALDARRPPKLRAVPSPSSDARDPSQEGDHGGDTEPDRG